MKKRILQGLVAAGLICVLTVTPVFATSIQDMKKDKAEAETQVEALQSQLTDILDKITTLQSDLEQKEEEIDKTNMDLEISINDQNEQYDAMKLRIKYMYEEGNSSFIETLLSAKSFSDLLNKAAYVAEVHSYDREKLDEYVETTKEIEKLQTSLQAEVKELESMQASLETEKINLNTTISSKESEIAQLDQEIQDALKAQQEAEEAARREEAARQEAINNQQNNVQNNTQSGNSSGNSNSSGNGSSQTIVPPQGQDGAALVQYARQFLGNPYVYGGNSLTNGIDCSGFTQQIYAAFGVSLPRTADAQASCGVEIPLSEAKAGDLLCYWGHVGIYNGSGGIIHASSPQVGIVEWGSCQYRSLKCVRRVL